MSNFQPAHNSSRLFVRMENCRRTIQAGHDQESRRSRDMEVRRERQQFRQWRSVGGPRLMDIRTPGILKRSHLCTAAEEVYQARARAKTFSGPIARKNEAVAKLGDLQTASWATAQTQLEKSSMSHTPNSLKPGPNHTCLHRLRMQRDKNSIPTGRCSAARRTQAFSL